MKQCPRCALCLDDESETCASDGERLSDGFSGSRIIDGKYRVDRALGEGGMGLIYQARHLALQRNFAIKIIQPVDAADPIYLARFRVEAQALGRLKHPNIVDVTDFGIDPREGGLPYLVMEFLEGITLSERLRREGPFEPEQLLPILDAIARAVDFAHSNGVLHRDLKPANVFLSEGRPFEEAVKVLDFGVARLLGEDASAKASERTTVSQSLVSVRFAAPDSASLTRTGVVMGSVPYISPEVLRHEAPSTASDIYSFGILVYEAVVGRLPFVGEPRPILLGHMHENPPAPSSLRESLPKELDTSLLAPLQKLPGKRPVRAADLVAKIRDGLGRSSLARWKRVELPRRRWISIAAGLGFVALSALLWRSSALRALETRTADLRFRSLPARPPDPRLLLVSIDDSTLEADSTPLAQKADEFGAEIDHAFANGAKAVAIDLLLPETWSRSKPFSDSVLRHAPSLTLSALSSASGAVVGPECIAGLTTAALGPEQASSLFGAVNLVEDPDRVVRRGWLFYPDREAGERAAWATRAVDTLVPGKSQSLRDTVGDSYFWIDYSVRRDRLPRVSWKDFAARIERDPKAVEGRLVLIGGDFTGGGDEAHALPSTGEADGQISGLVLQALIVDTLLRGAKHRDVPSTFFILAAGAAAGGVIFAILSQRLIGALAAVGGLILAYVAIAFLVFRLSGSVLPVAGPVISLALAVGGGLILKKALPARPATEIRT